MQNSMSRCTRAHLFYRGVLSAHDNDKNQLVSGNGQAHGCALLNDIKHGELDAAVEGVPMSNERVGIESK